MDLKSKILAGKRIDFDEALGLYDMDIFELGELADSIRQKKTWEKNILQY